MTGPGGQRTVIFPASGLCRRVRTAPDFGTEFHMGTKREQFKGQDHFLARLPS